MSKNLDAEFQAEVEVVRRRLMGQPVTEAPDPGVHLVISGMTHL
jgi:hypothetical protein